MWRLHRYLAQELLRPFAAALLLLFQLLFAMQLLRGTDMVFGSGAGAADVGRIALLLAPHFLAMALPIAFLVGVLIGLGRLAEDRELLALSAAGVDPLALVWVPLGLAALLSVVGLWLGREIEPRGLAGVRDQAAQLLRKNLQGDVKSGFFDDLTGLTLYAEQVDPKTHGWTHVLVHDDRDRASPLLVLAERGALRDAPGAAVTLQLEDGEVHRSAATGDEYALLHFDAAQFDVGLGEDFFRKSAFRAATEELTLDELRAAAERAPAEGRNPDELWTAAARRFALPLAPLAFALVAVPLGARLRRGARSLGFALAAGSFALYYVVARLGQQWGDAGKLPPMAAAQLANVVFALLGAALLLSARRRA